jgi:hypothetical protein
MSLFLWALVLLAIALNAYVAQFTSETLRIGRELSRTDSKTGLQDAITPPWLTTLGWAVYGGTVVLLGVIWWQLGWLPALMGTAVLFLGIGILKGVLARAMTEHYGHMILGSMVSRYADFVRHGDGIRAAAMKELLERYEFDSDLISK